MRPSPERLDLTQDLQASVHRRVLEIFIRITVETVLR
jgi:hypothetical protein